MSKYSQDQPERRARLSRRAEDLATALSDAANPRLSTPTRRAALEEIADALGQDLRAAEYFVRDVRLKAGPRADKHGLLVAAGWLTITGQELLPHRVEDLAPPRLPR